MIPDKLSIVIVDHRLINLITITNRTYHPNLKSNPDLSNINPSIINAAWSAKTCESALRSEAFLKNRKKQENKYKIRDFSSHHLNFILKRSFSEKRDD